MSEKFEEKIYFEDEGKTLVVSITYERIYTKKEEEQLKNYYQLVFSRKTGIEVPKEEITVSPLSGEKVTETVFFRVKENKPLYKGLYSLPEKAPHVIPELINSLKKVKKNTPVVDYTIKELEKILNKYE